MAILILFLFPIKSSALSTINSNWADSIPVIDGNMGANEWEDALSNNFTTYIYQTNTTAFNATYYIKNNAKWLYVLLIWPDTTHNSMADTVYVKFDENEDGFFTFPNGENAAIMHMKDTWESFGDYVYSGSTYVGDIHQNGTGAFNWANNQYIVEFSIPIDSPESDDIQPGPGETLGLGFLFTDGSTANHSEFPFNSSSGHHPATLSLATNPTTTGAIGIEYSIIYCSLTILISAIIVYKKRIAK